MRMSNIFNSTPATDLSESDQASKISDHFI